MSHQLTQNQTAQPEPKGTQVKERNLIQLRTMLRLQLKKAIAPGSKAHTKNLRSQPKS